MAITDEVINHLIDQKLKEAMDQRVEALVEAKFKEQKESKTKRMAIILSSKGTMDGAYSALILSTTAVALGMEVGIFFTFFGLNVLKKSNLENLKFVPLGNPATPMPMPNIVTMLPGMTAMATMMMKRTIRQKNIATIPQLMEIAIEGGVKLWPCQMTMDMFDLKRGDLIDGLPEPCGAATFMEFALEADITLFM